MKGEFEWSESGLNLLKEITDCIARSGGSYRVAKMIEHERHKDYGCAKRECFYCKEFERLYRLTSPTEPQKSPAPRTGRTEYWKRRNQQAKIGNVAFMLRKV